MLSVYWNRQRIMKEIAVNSCLKLPSILVLPFLLLVSILHSSSAADESFDVRLHLSTVSSYDAVRNVVDTSFVPTKIPDDCKPIHLNLVARHGTRSPTKKRLKELERLSDALEMLVADAEKNKVPQEKIPSWFIEWKSPWKGKVKGGELIIKGERELYELGLRIKERYADLFSDEYHPDVYPIKATQVPRASASAVAFGMGLFSGKGTLGKGRNRAFAINTESRASDILLRFHDTCQSYKALRKSQEPTVEKSKEPIFNEITESLCRRYELNFTRQHISSLWFLCKQEASLLDITDQACQLFSPAEVALLEWTDDLEAFVLKAYGKSLNYRMGVPLLNDVLQSMEIAIKANEEAQPAGSYEKARLRFAHAETLVPFSCLLGLFLEGSDFEQILSEKPLQLPPRPPQRRAWRASSVAPFAGNNMLVLYNCPANESSKYFVHALHNEHPIPLPGCGNSDFCPFDVFKEKTVAPHLKHDYNSVCHVVKNTESNPKPGKLSLLYRWLFPVSEGNTNSGRNEL
ncbi:hypothetical protein V2J09_014129 [Rumex salicifolius]